MLWCCERIESRSPGGPTPDRQKGTGRRPARPGSSLPAVKHAVENGCRCAPSPPRLKASASSVRGRREGANNAHHTHGSPSAGCCQLANHGRIAPQAERVPFPHFNFLSAQSGGAHRNLVAHTIRCRATRTDVGDGTCTGGGPPAVPQVPTGVRRGHKQHPPAHSGRSSARLQSQGIPARRPGPAAGPPPCKGEREFPARRRSEAQG